MKEYLYKIHVMLFHFTFRFLFSATFPGLFLPVHGSETEPWIPQAPGSCDVVFPVIKEYGFPGIELIHRAEFFINLSIRFCHFINIRKQCSVHVGQEFHLVAGQLIRMLRIVRQNIQMVSLFFQGFYPIFSVWHQFHHVTKIIIYRLHFFF